MGVWVCFQFLLPDDALRVQVIIQALGLDIKRAKQQVAGIEQEHSACPQATSSSVLDHLLGLDSEGEGSNEEDISQEHSGESKTVRNRFFYMWGKTAFQGMLFHFNGGRKMQEGSPP